MKKLQLASIIFFTLLSFSLAAQHYQIENDEVKITAAVNFKTGTAQLLPESDAALLVIKKYLDEKTYISLLRVEAHGDNSDDEKSNQLLTEQRAAAVCQKLITMGVDCMRLLPVGFGSNKPLAENSTAEGRNNNRRISFVNAALKGKAIGGMPLDGGGKTAGNPCH